MTASALRSTSARRPVRVAAALLAGQVALGGVIALVIVWSGDDGRSQAGAPRAVMPTASLSVPGAPLPPGTTTAAGAGSPSDRDKAAVAAGGDPEKAPAPAGEPAPVDPPGGKPGEPAKAPAPGPAEPAPAGKPTATTRVSGNGPVIVTRKVELTGPGEPDPLEEEALDVLGFEVGGHEIGGVVDVGDRCDGSGDLARTSDKYLVTCKRDRSGVLRWAYA